MNPSRKIRFISALLAVAMVNSTFAATVVSAQGTGNIDLDNKDGKAAAVEQAEQLLQQQLGVEGTLVPADDTVTAPGTDAAGQADTAPDTDTASDSAAANADGTADTSPEQENTQPPADEPNLVTPQTGTAPEGTVSMTDTDGNTVTADEENHTITGTLADSGEKESLLYNDYDADKTADGWNYLGTDGESGAAHYMMQYSQNELDEAETDYATEDDKESAETEEFLDWAGKEPLSGDALAAAMQTAAAFDQQVLEECFEPVYDDTDAAAYALENGDETPENTPAPAGYKLKDEYADQTIETDKVTFGAPQLLSGADPVAVQSADNAAEQSADPAAPDYESTTVVIVDNSNLLIRVLDEDGNGIPGAAVSVVTADLNYSDYTKEITGDPDSAGSVLINLGSETGKQDAFVNISCPGYRGITRVSETIEGGTVLTYVLHKANPGEIYLRGASLDGIDVYETNYELFINGQNQTEYDLTFFVEKVGEAPSILPDSLTLRSNGISKNDRASINQTDYTYQNQPDSYGYRMYTFRGQWSNYNKTNPIFELGKQVDLQWSDGTTWANAEANDTSVLPLKIDVSLPVIEDTESTTWKFSLSPIYGAGATVPEDVPIVGGGDISCSALSALPIYLYYDPDGTVLMGYGYTTDAQAMMAKLSQDDPNKSRPSVQEKRKTVMEKLKENFDEGRQTRAEVSKLRKEARDNGKKVAFSGDGSVDLYFGVMALIKLDRRTGYYNGSISLMAMVDGNYTATWYITTLPVYFGIYVDASGQLNFTAGVNAQNLLSISSWSGLSDDTGIALLISMMIQPFLGVGIQGFAGAEVYGNVGLDMLFNFTGVDSKKPDGASYPRARGYISANVGYKVYLFFLQYKKNYEVLSKRIWDSWGVKDKNDTEADIPGGEVTQALLTDENGNRVVPAALLADPEARANAADASKTENGLYVQQGSKTQSEVTISSGKQQTVTKKAEETPDAPDTEQDGTTTGVLKDIATSQQMTYAGVYYQGRFFRIANVKDNQYYGGAVVPRVTVTSVGADGVKTDDIYAIPATVDSDGKVYGYDYSFGVYMTDYKTYYVVIASSCVDPATSTLKEVAENTRLRVVLMMGSGAYRSRVLDKPEIDGSKAYLYTGAPIVYGSAYWEGAAINPFDPDPTKIGGYRVACNITTDLNSLTAATADATATAQVNDAVYVATNMNDREVDDPKTAILQDGTVRSNLQFVSAKGGEDLLAYVDYSNPSVLGLARICSTPYELLLNKVCTTDLGGEIHNLQYPNQESAYGLYCTINGRLTKLDIAVENDRFSVQKTDYPTTTDTGEQVVLPTSDGLQIVKVKDTLFLVTAYQQRGDRIGNGRYQTDSVIVVYTLYEDGGTPKLGGPRKTLLKNRAVFNATCAATMDMNSPDYDYVLRLFYLADQKAQIVKSPSGELQADKYYLGTTDDVCNLYMWELHTGVAAKLNSIKPASFYVRKTDDYLYLNGEVTNTGAYAADYVTVAVTTDKNNEKEHGDRQDINVYFSDDNTANGNNRHKLGPGSTEYVSIKVPLKDTWVGATTLYAAVMQVNGQELTEGFTPVWVDSDQLLDNGAFGLHVEEDGIGGKPYAIVRIDNYAATPFSTVGLDVEVIHIGESEEWEKVLRYKLGNNSAVECTGYDDKAATLRIPLEDYWNQDDVYALRFSLVSLKGDVTLNNTYKISDALLRPVPPKTKYVLASAGTADATMGSASVAAQDGATHADGSLTVAENTELTFTATNNENYAFDRWQVYDFAGNSWVDVPGNVATLKVTAGQPVTGTDIGKGENQLRLRACFKPEETKARLIIMAVEEKNDTKEIVQDGSLTDLLTVTDPNHPSDAVKDAVVPVSGAKGYILQQNATVDVEAGFDSDQWVLDGWYAFTYNEGGTITLGKEMYSTLNKIQASDIPTATRELCLAAKFHVNENPTRKVYLDSNGLQVTGENVNRWVNVNQDGTVTLPNLQCEGYTFLGWARADGVTPCVADTNDYEPYEHLFAQWQQSQVSLAVYSNLSDEYGTVAIQDSQTGNYNVYAREDRVTVQATATDKAVFDHWEKYNWVTGSFETVSDAAATYTLTLTEDDTVLQACFTKKTTPAPDPGTTPVPTAPGTVTPAPTANPQGNAARTSATESQQTAGNGDTATAAQKIPNTRDSMPILFWLAAMLISACAAFALRRRRRR